jgi:alkaline phosphatase D
MSIAVSILRSRRMSRPPRTTRPLINLIQDGAPADAGRRGFVRRLAAGAGALGAMPLLAHAHGRDDDNEDQDERDERHEHGHRVRFTHGVASGDPLSDRVILWTRVTPVIPRANARIGVRWEVARDARFRHIVARGRAVATAASDYTVKVDPQGLRPATTYHYRFSVGDTTSPAGRTRTLPKGDVDQVKLAVFSCANYPAGFFNVYADAARRQDLDATVHLGDYLYEYGQGGYASADAAALGRLVDPVGEIVSLQDYRLRHAQYRGDADLQALHAMAPMIAVWDDHEITNDSWRDGAENHQPATEGAYSVRKAAAIQAYHEWMPTRVAQPGIIYRSFDFGSLVSLHMLDTRLAGRDQQLDYNDYFTATGFDAAGFTAAVANPARQLLGAEQTTWLQQQLSRSTATWQVLGQQVLMGRMNIPAPILVETITPGAGVSVSQYAAIAAKARSAPATLTTAERAILAQPSIPYNLDAWDGHAVARETVLGTALSLKKNLVVLSGDTHNAWANELNDRLGNPVGVEFATSSVTSPGFEAYLPNENPAVLAGALQQLISPLKYCDTSRRGYMVITATREACQADWVHVDTIAQHAFVATTDKSLKVLAGGAGRIVSA